MKRILIGFLIAAVLFALFCVIDNHVDKGELIPTENPYEKRLERKILAYIDQIKQLETDFENLAIINGEMIVKLRHEKSTLKLSVADCEKVNQFLIKDMNILTLEYTAREKQMKNSHGNRMGMFKNIITEKDKIITELKREILVFKAMYAAKVSDFDIMKGELKTKEIDFDIINTRLKRERTGIKIFAVSVLALVLGLVCGR